MTSTPASANGIHASATGPRGLPLLGNLPAFARDPLAFFCHLRDNYGDWVPWSLGPKRSLLVSRPEDVGELLAGVEVTFSPVDLGWAIHQVLGEGVVTSTGADWRRKRALVQPSVRPRQVRAVPEGTTVWASQWAVHRDPRCFREPDAFLTGRWTADAPDVIPDHAWFPFGGGQRTCLGARFALVEAVLVLAVLTQRWHLETAPGEVKPNPGLTLQPSRAIPATVRCS